MFDFVRLIFFVFSLMIFAYQDLEAQTVKTPANSEGYWLGYFGDNKITNRLGVHTELQLRSFFMPHANQTLLSRVGLSYYATPKIVATVGYGYIHSIPSSDAVIGSVLSEHRVWQQMLVKQTHTKFNMDHRYRLEQRLIHNISNNTNQIDYRVRYRYQVLFPLDAIVAPLQRGFLVVNNEIMLNLKADPANVFDRNRFFAGVGYLLDSKNSVQLGYLNQYAHTVGKSTPHIDHVLVASLMYNIDFSRKNTQ